MKRKGKFVKKILYKYLSMESYLRFLSHVYFISFNLGVLKNNRLYEYPYFIKNIFKKGDVCIDIGANLGYLTVLFAKLAGPSGKVYAIEPVKPVLNVLKKNTRRFKNVDILPFALGTENKTISLSNNTIKRDGFMASGSNVVKENIELENSELEFQAEMRRGSELFSSIKALDFIKCDIEGYESIVIPELKPIIKQHQPMVLLEARRQSRIQMMAFFKELNYRALVLDNGKLQPAKENEYWDILFVPENKIETIKVFLA